MSPYTFVHFLSFPSENLSSLSFENLKGHSFFRNWAEGLQKKLEDEAKALIISFDPMPEQNPFTYAELKILIRKVGEFFGDLLEQNEKGDKTISVYDRDRLASMANGARYHQTREGGSIHTDNVNTPEPWDYLFFGCLSPGEAGGESILVDGAIIHQKLKIHYPKALQILEKNFFWEMRGLSDTLYEAPIMTYDPKGVPQFRYLRPYMEAAHVKAGCPFSLEQLYALDLLDALLNISENQFRYTMKKGDLLVCRDSQILHGRTCFSDAMEAVPFDDFLKFDQTKPLKRTMERLWVRKN